MRHARAAALDELEEVIAKLRTLPGLKEKSRGTFHRGSKSFVHFHEDPDGLFADARIADAFERFRVSTAKERSAFLTAVRTALAEDAASARRARSRRQPRRRAGS